MSDDNIIGLPDRRPPLPSEVLPPFEFDRREIEGEPFTFATAIGQAIGAASMCWATVDGAGAFDSERACQIIEALYDEIEAHIATKAATLSAVPNDN